MPSWDLLLTNARIATMQESDVAYGVIENGALGIADGKIAWVGLESELPSGINCKALSLHNRWLTPALIDCHTHVVFGGNRAEEFEQRLMGVSYEEIAKAGGGILSTVNATRSASSDELANSAAVRLHSLAREGVATVEIKSGYGLDVENELKMLRVARSLAGLSGISTSTSFLAAHAVPAEFAGKADQYIEMLCEEALPQAAEAGLVDAVDAYCESIAFSTDQIARLFETAQALNLPVKLHADQLSDSGGAELAASFHALSADHLEYTSNEGISALADAGCVAVLLPGAFLTLGETQLPPIDTLREKQVPIAVATDCNPGTSPVCSLRSAMNLATSLFKLTPEECLAGTTREAARALGLLHDRGTLEKGKRADVAVWNIGHPRELSYWLGLNELSDLFIGGREIFRS
ncbi:MAG: imidazolonepropionase [Proteobacteria bacterium]|nr:imidazolonepropionase [Pseudomonadota bacterium]